MAFTGQISVFAGLKPPRDWAFCDGKTVPIASYQALFAVIGAQFGGDGHSTFMLPDLRGRVALAAHAPNYTGHHGGLEKVRVTLRNMPKHSHSFTCEGGRGTEDTPKDNVPAGVPNGYSASGSETFGNGVVQQAGGNGYHDNMQPFLAMNFIICLKGRFPSKH